MTNHEADVRRDKLAVEFAELKGMIGGKIDLISEKIEHLAELTSDRYITTLAAAQNAQQAAERVKSDLTGHANADRDEIKRLDSEILKINSLLARAVATVRGAVIGWVLAGGFGGALIWQVLTRGSLQS